MKARRCCWLQESSCGSDSVAESHRGGHACSCQPTRVHAGTPGLVGPEWCRGPCPGARLPQGGVWEGQGPDPVHLSANRLTSTPWAAFPVTSYDSITASELKAKLFQKGKNKGNLHSPAGQHSQLGTEQWLCRCCRWGLCRTAVMGSVDGGSGDGSEARAARVSDRLRGGASRPPEQQRPLSSSSIGITVRTAPLVLSDHRPPRLPQHMGPQSESTKREHPHHILGVSTHPCAISLSQAGRGPSGHEASTAEILSPGTQLQAQWRPWAHEEACGHWARSPGRPRGLPRGFGP